MADAKERRIARRAAQGDPLALVELTRERIRSGELPRFSFRLPARERVERWLAERSVANVSVEPVALSDALLTPTARRAAQALRLTWWMPYEAPDQVRTLLGSLLEHVEWTDAAQVHVQPVAHLQHFRARADLLVFAPQEVFASPEALEALDAGRGAVEDAVAEALIAAAAAMPEGEAAAFRAELREFCTLNALTVHLGEAPAPFDERAPAALAPLIRDARALADLERSLTGLVQHLDEWENTRCISADGAVTGRALRLPVWTSYQSIYGVDTVPELRDDGEARVRPEAWALYAQAADLELPSTQRADAARLLSELPPEEGLPWQVQLLGWPEHRSAVLDRALRLDVLVPLFRALILERSPGRIEEAFARLRGFGDEFHDPLDAWRRASDGPSRLGFMTQETILDLGCERQRGLIQPLVDELRAQVEGRSAQRRGRWFVAALRGLRSAPDAAAELALTVAEWPDPEVRSAALSVFGSLDYAPAHAPLRAALRDQVLDVVSGAEIGLAGQRSLAPEELFGHLRTLEARAQREGADALGRRDLGVHLLRAIGERGLTPQGADAECVRAVAARAVWLSNAARRLVTWVQPDGAPESGQASDGAPPTGATPSETFDLRYALWTQPGAVARHIAARCPEAAWATGLRAAHVDYEARRGEAATEAFRRAVDDGCDDGLVIYRLAVGLASSPDQAVPLLQRAAALLAEQYPESPYRSAAFEAIGNLRRAQGRREEALVAFRQAAAEPQHPPKTLESLRHLEEEVALRAVQSVATLQSGALRRTPSRWHPGPVCGVALRSAGRELRLLSWDESGWVQVSRVDEVNGPKVIPWLGHQAHPPGRTAAAWVSPDRFVCGGVDGLLWRGSVESDAEALDVEPLIRHAEPVVQLAPLSNEGLAYADASGAVYTWPGAGAPQRLGADAGPIHQVRVYGRRLVARTSEALLCWDLDAGPAPVWTAAVASVYLGSTPGGELGVALAGGRADAYRLSDGHRNGALAVPSPEPLLAFELSDGEGVWSWPHGPVRVLGATPLTAIVTDPLRALCVHFPARAVAHADIGRRLHVLRWRD